MNHTYIFFSGLVNFPDSDSSKEAVECEDNMYVVPPEEVPCGVETTMVIRDTAGRRIYLLVPRPDGQGLRFESKFCKFMFFNCKQL